MTQEPAPSIAAPTFAAPVKNSADRSGLVLVLAAFPVRRPHPWRRRQQRR